MFEDLHHIAATALASDMFAAGLALGTLGLAAGLLHGLWRRIAGLLARRLCVSLTVDNRVAAFHHLMLWVESAGVLAHARRLRVTEIRDGNHDMLAPAPGTHWFVHQGRLCCFTRVLNEKARVTSGHHNSPMESVTLTVFGARMSRLKGWLTEGEALQARRIRKGPGLHVLKGDWWDHVGDVPRRSLATVLSDDDRVADLLADLTRFFAAEDWYAERGVPWRRGYLLHGPPGTGKSSVIRALASETGRDLATLDIGRPSLGDDDLREAMFSAPAHALIVMEDIDALFRQREDRMQGISFSGLLNAIDGLAAQEGRALFMTTNHKERLDPALIRPGRADLHVELGPVGAVTAERLFLRFFPGEDALATRFRQALGERTVTPARLQGWLLMHADDPLAASAAAGLGTADVTGLAAE